MGHHWCPKCLANSLCPLFPAVHLYLQEEHSDLINDMQHVLSLRVDHTRVVDIMRKAAGYLHLNHTWLRFKATMWLLLMKY
jgi:hypothetical protein